MCCIELFKQTQHQKVWNVFSVCSLDSIAPLKDWMSDSLHFGVYSDNYFKHQKLFHPGWTQNTRSVLRDHLKNTGSPQQEWVCLILRKMHCIWLWKLALESKWERLRVHCALKIEWVSTYLNKTGYSTGLLEGSICLDWEAGCGLGFAVYDCCYHSSRNWLDMTMGIDFTGVDRPLKCLLWAVEWNKFQTERENKRKDWDGLFKPTSIMLIPNSPTEWNGKKKLYVPDDKDDVLNGEMISRLNGTND